MYEHHKLNLLQQPFHYFRVIYGSLCFHQCYVLAFYGHLNHPNIIFVEKVIGWILKDDMSWGSFLLVGIADHISPWLWLNLAEKWNIRVVAISLSFSVTLESGLLDLCTLSYGQNVKVITLRWHFNFAHQFYRISDSLLFEFFYHFWYDVNWFGFVKGPSFTLVGDQAPKSFILLENIVVSPWET